MTIKTRKAHLTFTFDQNRSERAQQADVLVPVLADPIRRAKLLPRLDVGDADPITEDEAKAATVMHFVWVLRDSFTAARDATRSSRSWQQLVERWASILYLPGWASDINWWRHPSGEYEGDPSFVVHPCNNKIGWTRPGIKQRIDAFGINLPLDDVLPRLEAARQVMNTESDCFVQTTARLIIIECKDKTGFSNEQRARQQRLGKCLARLLPRPNPTVFVDVARGGSQPTNLWTWDELAKLLRE